MLALAAVAMLASTGLAADTYPRQPGVAISQYTFDFSVTDGSDEIAVVETVQLQLVAAGVSAVELDLCNFSAPPRSGQLASGFRDPCAEPTGGGRGGAAAVKP